MPSSLSLKVFQQTLQEPWLTGEWATRASLVAAAVGLVCLAGAWRFYKWD